MKAIKFFSVIKFLKAIFSPAVNDLKKIENTLNLLKGEMCTISLMDNKVEAIVRLFKIISPIQDEGGFSQTIFKLQKKNYGQLDQIISALNILQVHFKNAGRSEHGINRTKVGEEVTSAKIFLGDVFGIWTKPASYWLEEKDELKNQIRKDVSRDPNNPVTTWYIINDYQAGEFVKSHTDGILEQISFLKKVA